jgi:hypothetical protein
VILYHSRVYNSGTDFLGGAHPPEMICTPPEAFGTAPKSLCTPANYIYFDLIVSYLIILTTKFVKLPILWSQISPCRPRKQILLNFSLGLSGRYHQASAKASSSTPPPIYLFTPPNENMKIRLWIHVIIFLLLNVLTIVLTVPILSDKIKFLFTFRQNKHSHNKRRENSRQEQIHL